MLVYARVMLDLLFIMYSPYKGGHNEAFQPTSKLEKTSSHKHVPCTYLFLLNMCFLFYSWLVWVRENLGYNSHIGLSM